MGQETTVAVEAPAAEGEGENPSQGQILEGALGLGGQGPGGKVGPSEGQLGRLDADQAHLGGTGQRPLQDQGVAVHHLAHADPRFVLGGERLRDEQRQDGEYGGAADGGHGLVSCIGVVAAAILPQGWRRNNGTGAPPAGL